MLVILSSQVRYAYTAGNPVTSINMTSSYVHSGLDRFGFYNTCESDNNVNNIDDDNFRDAALQSAIRSGSQGQKTNKINRNTDWHRTAWHGGPGVCLGDGQTEAEGVPLQRGRGDALLRRMSPYLT